MIGWLKGDVRLCDPSGDVVLDVQGVGYLVHVPVRAVSELTVGTDAEFFVHTSVRDDAIVLFGFLTPHEKTTFQLLLSIPGVGPSTALGALSTMTPDQLADAVAAEDITGLSRIPGIGRKTAARLVLELNGKLPHLSSDAAPSTPDTLSSDVAAALRQLGYGTTEIREALSGVELPDDDAGALRVALRQLGRR